MDSRIVIKGKEITNPFAKAVILIFAILVVGGIAALIIFLVLPLIGIIVSLSLGLVAVFLIGLGIGIPLILIGGALVGAIIAPFTVLKDRLREKSKRGP
ncbi:hypothetical protein LR032_05565 [Candidatus Bipolaricaulota bacterium]|nr:hypothetical protein [Candidatus Bipolaricaulota bacterium]